VVKGVAQYLRFADQATFSRQFREQFGFPPSDALGTFCGPNSASIPAVSGNFLSSSENPAALANLLY